MSMDKIYFASRALQFQVRPLDDLEVRLNFNCFALPEAARAENDIFIVSVLFAVINSASTVSHLVYRASFI